MSKWENMKEIAQNDLEALKRAEEHILEHKQPTKVKNTQHDFIEENKKEN